MWSLFKSLNSLLAAIRENTVAVQQQIESSDRTRAVLELLAAQMAKLLDRLRNLPDPEPVSILVTLENQNMLTFKISLPALPPEPNDIASGEITLTIGGNEPQIIATAKDQTEIDGLSGQQGDHVTVAYAYIDDAGNRSVHPSSVEVDLSDTIPPADPGALGLTITGEV